MRSILTVFALLIGLSFMATAQEAENAKFNKWVNGTGYTTQMSPYILYSANDTTQMQSFEDYLSSAEDTLIEMAFYATDTAQSAAYVDYFMGTSYISSTPLDSLVYKFNTDKLSPVAVIGVSAQRPPGATHFRGRVVHSANFNKGSNASRILSTVISK